jgi:hypothetical protein
LQHKYDNEKIWAVAYKKDATLKILFARVSKEYTAETNTAIPSEIIYISDDNTFELGV